MKTRFQFALAPLVAALLAVASPAPVFADEPAAKEQAQRLELPRQAALHGAASCVACHEQAASPRPIEQDSAALAARCPGLQLRYAVGLATSANALIGVEVAPPDEVLRSHLGLGKGGGLVVTSVTEGAPAAQAGIQVNDVLTGVGGEEIVGVEKLQQLLEASLDKPISLGFIRAGQRQAVEVTPHAFQLADLPIVGKVYARDTEPVKADEPKYWLGVGLAGADDVLRSQLGVAAGEGLVVTGVEEDSPAAKAGVMANDLLVKLDGQPLKSIEELSAQLQEIKDKSVAIELLRRGKPAQLSVTPQLRPESAVRYVDFDADGDLDIVLSEATGELVARSLLVGALKAEAERSLLALGGTAEAAPEKSLSARIGALLEQSRQFQAELEKLQALLKEQDQPPKVAP